MGNKEINKKAKAPLRGHTAQPGQQQSQKKKGPKTEQVRWGFTSATGNQVGGVGGACFTGQSVLLPKSTNTEKLFN